jgi:hypothetical protein
VKARAAPGDHLVAAYNLILVFVWLPVVGQLPHASWIAAAHLTGAGLPWLFGRVPRRLNGPAVALRDVYPLILNAAFWTELDLIRTAYGAGHFDHVVAPLDQAVFGTHLHKIWMPSMSSLWFSEVMFFMYSAYYVLIVAPLIVAGLRGQRAALRDMVFRLVTGYAVCYLIYIPFPVYGPHFPDPPHVGEHTRGLFYQLTAAVQAGGDSRGAAIPSSHVVGAVTIAISGWRWFSRPVAILLTLEAVGVALATVYTQNHYAIDSVAGIAIAVPLQLSAVPALQRVLRSPVRLPAVALPRLSSVFRRAGTPEGSG